MAQAKTKVFLEEESIKSIGTEERKVIFASSLGTVFEWYDFYLYATLAPFFAALFFPSGNETAALLSAFATYAAGFLVRPFGAIVFGRIGDLVGRKYTFLITIVFMGGATFLVVVSNILDAITALDPYRVFLPTHFQYSWLDALTPTINPDDMIRGTALAVIYSAVFFTAAWVRFARKDITS